LAGDFALVTEGESTALFWAERRLATCGFCEVSADWDFAIYEKDGELAIFDAAATRESAIPRRADGRPRAAVWDPEDRAVWLEHERRCARVPLPS
jgi:hypothetical protein